MYMWFQREMEWSNMSDSNKIHIIEVKDVEHFHYD